MYNPSLVSRRTSYIIVDPHGDFAWIVRVSLDDVIHWVCISNSKKGRRMHSSLETGGKGEGNDNVAYMYIGVRLRGTQ